MLGCSVTIYLRLGVKTKCLLLHWTPALFVYCGHSCRVNKIVLWVYEGVGGGANSFARVVDERSCTVYLVIYLFLGKSLSPVDSVRGDSGTVSVSCSISAVRRLLLPMMLPQHTLLPVLLYCPLGVLFPFDNAAQSINKLQQPRGNRNFLLVLCSSFPVAWEHGLDVVVALRIPTILMSHHCTR